MVCIGIPVTSWDGGWPGRPAYERALHAEKMGGVIGKRKRGSQEIGGMACGVLAKY